MKDAMNLMWLRNVIGRNILQVGGFIKNFWFLETASNRNQEILKMYTGATKIKLILMFLTWIYPSTLGAWYFC